MTTQTIFSNLFAAITAEKSKDLKKFIETANTITTVKEVVDSWSCIDLLPKSKRPIHNKVLNTYSIKGIDTIEELKTYLIDRKQKQVQKYLDKQLIHLQTVENAADLKEITVSMEWKPSRTWGSNPKAQAKVQTENDFKSFESGSIGGCGYDKGSTAVAEAVNQSNSFLKALYLVKEQQPTAVNRELFGYGSGYGILPRLEGGVGISCYPAIFNKIGFTFNTIASGKTYDVYYMAKIKEA